MGTPDPGEHPAAMLLADLVRASVDVAQTPARSGKVARLAALLRQRPPAEIAIAVAYLSGGLRQGRVGVGPSAIFAARLKERRADVEARPATRRGAVRSPVLASRPHQPMQEIAMAQLSLDNVGYVIFFVTDMDASVAFYRDTLGTPVRFASPEWTELDTKGATIALHAFEGTTPPKEPGTAEVVFGVADVRGAHAALRERKVEVRDLKQVHDAEGQVGVAASFRDPDGNWLSIYGMVPAAEWKKA